MAFWVTAGDAQGFIPVIALMNHSWAVFRAPQGMAGIEPRSATDKANALPVILSLQPLILVHMGDFLHEEGH